MADRQSYLDRAERSAATTVFSLVGHATLRIACAGSRLGPLAEQDLDWMEQMVWESLQQGA
jgi:N-acyl-D-aspartate/D-glutamate deacylase